MEPARHAEPHLRPRPPLNRIELGASNFSTIADLRALLLLRPPLAITMAITRQDTRAWRRVPVVVVVETEAPDLAEVRAAEPELEDL
jgi:hypothetical protein